MHTNAKAWVTVWAESADQVEIICQRLHEAEIPYNLVFCSDDLGMWPALSIGGEYYSSKPSISQIIRQLSKIRSDITAGLIVDPALLQAFPV